MNYLRNEKLLENFGARIKALRQERGLSLLALANECDMELSQVHRIEQGKINTTLSTLQALAKGLNIPMSELVEKL
jgi:transcriptional regulator with XRE-family HTH domain